MQPLGIGPEHCVRAHNKGVYASALTPDQARELRALRARAYGPDADIDSDPVALQRLRDLESWEHIVPAASDPPAAFADALPAPAAEFERRQDVDAVGESSAPPAPPTARSAKVRQWLASLPPLAWIVAAATVLLVAAGVWAVSQVTASDADFTLAELSSDETPPPLVADNYFTALYGVSSDGMRAHEPYRTITPWSWTAADGTRCLLLTVEGFDRPAGGSCTPAGIDPIHDVTIWPGLSRELIGDLPQGSVIRFELRDARVHVWVRRATERS